MNKKNVRGLRLLYKARWPLAALSPFLVSLLQLPIMPQAPLYMFLACVLGVTWIGGLNPGIFCALLSSAVANFLFLEPLWQFTTEGRSLHEMCLFFCTACLLVILQSELSKTKASLTKALRARDDFLAVAGHELRNPLTALQLQLQRMLRWLQRDDLNVERFHTAMQTHASTLNRMVHLTDELLDVSRITAGHLDLHPEPVYLADMVKDVVERFDEAAMKANCRIVLNSNSSIVGFWDRLRMEQVITNLLSNALKYGPGGAVEIDIRADHGRAFLSVRDFGPGIAPQDRGRIFDRFERLPHHQKGVGGLGMGLWIVKEIVVMSGGTIEVEGAGTQGCIFTVTLPLKAMSAQPHIVEATNRSDSLGGARLS